MVTLYLVVGIPGSGKSTYIKKHAMDDDIIVSSDALRLELYGDENDQTHNPEVFAEAHRRIIDGLNDGNDVWFDATNITRKARAGIISVCPKHARIVAVVVWAPIDICIERDAARERTVGRNVIMRMCKNFEFPFYDEGINSIDISRGEFPEELAQKYLSDMDMSQDNPHHTLTVKDHCDAAAKYADEHYCSYSVKLAAKYHDIGKPLCKTFTNTKGEPTEIAHYYGHQGASAWMAIGYVYFEDAIWLISAHMEPYFNSKYYKSLPAFMRKRLDELHECDVATH